MFKENSRYANLPLHRMQRDDGQEVSYVGRRFLPAPEGLARAATERVGTSDRLDHIAQRAYGAPDQFWRLAEATLEFEPEELVRAPGRRLMVPMVRPE